MKSTILNIGLAAIITSCAAQVPNVKAQSAPVEDTNEKAEYQTAPAQAQEETEESTSVNYYTLADKVTCLAASSSDELNRRGLTCLKNLPAHIRMLDGKPFSSGQGTAGAKDGKLGAWEYGAALTDAFLSWERSCYKKGECKVTKPVLSRLMMSHVLEFIPAEVNHDCYLTPADDYNDDGNITAEDLTIFQATETDTEPIKCDYDNLKKTRR